MIEIELYIIQNFFLIIIFIIFRKILLNINLVFLNYFFLIFTIISIISFTHFKFEKNNQFNNEKNGELFEKNYFDNLILNFKPDIYHIIPDGLLNVNELTNYGYNNSAELYNKIKSSDLKYFEKSLTNYPATFFSISSTLNGSLFNENLNFYEEQINKTIYNSKLHNLLIKNNYKIFWYKTRWIGANCNAKKYKCMNNSFYNNEIFNNYLLLLNFSQAWIDKILYKFFKFQKKFHLDALSNDLDLILLEKKPRYVFGYLNLPHGPYTVDKNCTPIITKNLKQNIIFKKKHYFEQVDCFAKQLNIFTEKLKKNNNRPYIVIVQSDTGWSFNPKLIEEGRPNPKHPERLWPDTQFKNFLAISKNFNCIDNKGKISNADLFPTILNCLNNKEVNHNNNKKFDVYYSSHPKHGKIYYRSDLD